VPQRITVERLLLIAPENPVSGVRFEQAVDGLGFEAGALGEALCGATGRGAEGNRHSLGKQDFQH
jgi:hypothetical protein